MFCIAGSSLNIPETRQLAKSDLFAGSRDALKPDTDTHVFSGEWAIRLSRRTQLTHPRALYLRDVLCFQLPALAYSGGASGAAGLRARIAPTRAVRTARPRSRPVLPSWRTAPGSALLPAAALEQAEGAYAAMHSTKPQTCRCLAH